MHSQCLDKRQFKSFSKKTERFYYGVNLYIYIKKKATDVPLKIHNFKLAFSTNKSDSSSDPGLRQIVSFLTW